MAQLEGGTYGSGGDVIDHILYDTAEFATTIVRPETRFFSKGFGGAFGYTVGATKTLTETNLTDTGRLVAGQSFLVKSMSLAFVDNLDEDQETGASNIASKLMLAYRAILRSSIFEFRFANQDFAWQAPGDVFLPSIFVNGGQVTGAANTPSVRVGDFGHYNWIGIKTPLVIGEMVSFSVSMKTGSGDTGAGAVGTLLNDASTELFTAKSLMKVLLKGTLTRSK
jgi:hypothetical protein